MLKVNRCKKQTKNRKKTESCIPDKIVPIIEHVIISVCSFLPNPLLLNHSMQLTPQQTVCDVYVNFVFHFNEESHAINKKAMTS